MLPPYQQFFGQRSDFVGRMIDIMPDSYGMLMQFLSRRSRLDAAGVALEQFGVQGLLHSCDLHADARKPSRNGPRTANA
jgi:hypothetical protein